MLTHSRFGKTRKVAIVYSDFDLFTLNFEPLLGPHYWSEQVRKHYQIII